MKQQAISTFSEGMNFDLNPLTTPNNVLTDCVNGSFITFNGDELALQNDSGNTKIEYRTQVSSDKVNYGFLYNHYAAIDVRNLAASGWHVPSRVELETLYTTVSGSTIGGNSLRRIGIDKWSNANGTDLFGFNAAGGGIRSYSGGFSSLKELSTIWSTDNGNSGSQGWGITIYYTDSYIGTGGNSLKRNGLAIRLIKDDSTDPGTYIGNDGRVYNTTKIGSQVWLAENLAETKFRNGDWIAGYDGGVYTAISNGTWSTTTAAALSAYNHVEENATYIVVEDITEYVALSEGFYPLGIKEYGGLLYIISGKLPAVLAEDINVFSPGSVYAPQVIIKYSSNIEIFPYVFYKHTSTTSRAYSELPLESNKYWELIGSEQDYNNYAGEVEIGSYPSPEASAIKDYIGEDYILNSTETPLKLYKPKIINKELFKTGRYVTFSENTVANIGSITHYVKTAGVFVKVPSFYKIRLLHQLSNGYMDLTNHVWTKYLTFLSAVGSGTTKYHWADTILQGGNNFKYYCQSLYKGLLAMSLEIEDIDTFELEAIPSFKLNTTTYEFTLKIKAIPQASSSVTVPYVKVEIWIDNIANPIEIQAVTSNTATYVLTGIPDTEVNKLLSYRVTPILGYNTSYYAEDIAVIVDSPPTIENALPKEYIEKYTISGTSLISTRLDNITFRREPDNTSVCTDGLKSNYEYYIVNTDGAYIDPETLEETLTKYVFLTTGETITVGNTLKANYTISSITKKPTLDSVVGIDPGVVTLFHNLTVIEDCVYTIELTITSNMDLDEYSFISVTQNGLTEIYGYDFSTPDVKVLNIIPDVPVYITITKPGYIPVSIGETYSTAASENIALIANVVLENTGDLFRLWWNSTQANLPAITNPNYSIYTLIHTETPITASLEFVSAMEYSTMFHPVETYGTYDFAEFVSGTPVADNIYYNIIDNYYMEYEGVIFQKIIGATS